MLDVLRAEGYRNVEFMAVGTPGVGWESRAPGFDRITFPVMPDTDGVYYMYGVDPGNPYDAFLVDKRGRLVLREDPFTDAHVQPWLRRIRELHEE